MSDSLCGLQVEAAGVESSADILSREPGAGLGLDDGSSGGHHGEGVDEPERHLQEGSQVYKYKK